MTNLTPESVLPNADCSIVRVKSFGSTHENQSKIIKAIKGNIDSGCTVKAFTLAVHADPSGSPQSQELAFLVEYSDGHIELYDRHNMSINRTPRESEVISLVRSLTYLGAGHRIYFCTKRLHTKVFQQPPLLTATVIKSKGVKPLLSNWHQFTSVNNEGYEFYSKSIYKEKEWDKLGELSDSSINHVDTLGLDEFVKHLDKGDTVIAGYLGRSLKCWMFTVRRGRNASMTICDQSNVAWAYDEIVGKFDMKAYGDFVKEEVEFSLAQRLISLNQDQFITDFNQSNDKWLFDRVLGR